MENRQVLEPDRLETDPQDPSQAIPRARPSSPRDVGKLRITFVLPQRSLSGGARVVVHYGNELIDRGHTVTIACMPKAWPRRPRALLHQIQRDLRSYALRDHVNDFKGAVLTVRSHKLASGLPDADVVLATHWSTAEPVADLPDTKGQKVQFLQGYEAHSSGPEMVDATWRLPLRRIVVSRWLQDLARDRFGDSDAVLVPNGLDLAVFDAPKRTLNRPPVVGLVYHRALNKGIDVGLKAIRLAQESIPELGVVSFGFTKPTAALPLPPGGRFHLRPGQSRIPELYRQADVWLVASRSEGFGLPVLEAMACRCPVVATRCGGPEELIEEGVNGVLADVDDARGLADGIVTTLSSEATWLSMSSSAYETARRFDVSKSAEEFEAALSGVLDVA